MKQLRMPGSDAGCLENMVNDIMKKFTGLKFPRCLQSAGWVKLGMVIWTGLTLSVATAAPAPLPANDNFANAIDLTPYGDTGTTNGSNVGATTETGEPFARYFSASVWYQWTASTNETTEFDLKGSVFGTGEAYVLIYTNSGVGISNLVLCADGYLYESYFSSASFQAVAGQTYYISVAGYNKATGTFDLNWSSVVHIAAPNDNFANATVLTGDWGSTNADNYLATAETGEPSHAGYAANASLWYQWTASVDGVVTLDTIGGTNGLDTVLAVYTGTSLTTLNQVAANDDLYPINSLNPQYNYSSQGNNTTTYFSQPYYGPSGLRFNAKAGTTYYFAVDTKSTSNKGLIYLNWAYQPAGVFRFATEDYDSTTQLPLYQCAQTESQSPNGLNNTANSVVSTYYNYNAQGVLVTVTRVAGSTGRQTVQYATVDGTAFAAMPANCVPASEGFDYEPVSGTLIFDDYEMSKTILIPVEYLGIQAGDQTNRVFGIVLTNAQPDYLESSEVSQPRVDPRFGMAMVKIMNMDADPYGPDWVPVVVTNAVPVPDTNNPGAYVTNYITVTNLMLADYPTNAVFNFQKANYRVPADVNSTNSPWSVVTIWVERFGTNTESATVNYRVNNYLSSDSDAGEEGNAEFPLQPGSDYAVPTPASANVYRATNSDFNMVKGSISFPSSGNDAKYQPITFTVPTTNLTKFNKDFRIQLYREVSINGKTQPRLVGNVNEATVTILTDDRNPPAGAVDELYNADLNDDLALPRSQIPNTWPQNHLLNPGVSGEVYGLAVLTNDETLAVGNFSAYNGYVDPSTLVGQNNIALIHKDGSLDTAFNVGGGTEAAINAVAVAPGNQYVIGGAFSSYNGNGCGHFARLNADGSMDSSFSSSQGSGADDIVRAVVVQGDGKVVIGGDFTHVDGVARNHVARLNTDGSVDTTFDPGATLNGPVYALAVPPSFNLSFYDSSAGRITEVDRSISMGQNSSATLTMYFESDMSTNDMQVYYGDTNVAAGTGVLIYDTGYITNVTATSFTLPIGPTNGFATNMITIVVNPGGAAAGAAWYYSGSLNRSSSTSGILVGGNFSVTGQPYNNIARLNVTNGSLDTAFNPGVGLDSTVFALGWQYDGRTIAGGAFTSANGYAYNHIARFNGDGSVDTANFFVGTGADAEVHSITIQTLDGTIYVGGTFATFNGTHRLGFTRLYANGTVDTTFLDTAYNQFAGLKRIYSYDSPGVFAAGVQSDGDVMIGGEFNQVGGGEANTNVCNTLDDEMGYDESFSDIISPNLWVEPKTRDGVRNRSGIARLIGGATPGPGNLGFRLTSYSQNKSASSLTVELVRTNGCLGPVLANFAVQPISAQSGQDYVYYSTPPMDWIAWDYVYYPTRLHSDGLSGVSGSLMDPFNRYLTSTDAGINNLSTVTVSIIKNTSVSGNLNAQFQLANPSGADLFYLGGENIPLGSALGTSTAVLTINDNTQIPGTFGFSSAVYIATNTSVPISVLRSNGVTGSISVKASTTTNGTATAGTDYTSISLTNLTFNDNVVSNGFGVAVKNSGIIYTNYIEKTVALKLSNLGNTPAGATYGISNAVIRLINPSSSGYLTLSTNNFSGNISSGSLAFVVNRVSGSSGSLSVQYATTNGTALNGVDYQGATNTLYWNNADVSSRTVSVPLKNTGLVGGSKQFAVSLFNPTNNGVGDLTRLSPSSTTNATLTISNDNSYGILQFSAPSYVINENGGYAIITVVRVGGAVGTVSVGYATRNGSNTVGGVNYVPANGVLTFATNQISASFTVAVLNDGIVDPTNGFYFNVALTNAVNAALGSVTNAMVKLVDCNSFNYPAGSPDPSFTCPGMNGSVFSLALQGDGKILAGGSFSKVGSVAAGNLARLNAADGGLDTTFMNGLAGANGAVLAVVSQTDSNVLVGGSFTTVNQVNRRHIARLNVYGLMDTSFNPGLGADNTVNAIAETFVGGVRKIYVGGAFGAISGTTSPGFARLNNDGSSDVSFSTGTGADGSVYAIAVYPTNSVYAGKVLIGGSFTHFNAVTLNRLARLNIDGSLDTTFNAKLGVGPNGVVRALALQSDGGVLVGGSFTNFNGAVASYVARLNADGTTDTNFAANASANSPVEGIAVQADNRIVLVGQFTLANNITRNHITRLLPSGAADPTINFGDGADGDMDAVVIQPADGRLVVGGGFSQYDDEDYNNIVRIYGGSMTGSGAFQFTSDTYQVDETGVYAPITIRRTGGTSGTNADGSGSAYVNFATHDITAVAGINYSPMNQLVEFPAGEVLRQVSVPILDDQKITPDLTANLTLTPIAPATNGLQITATLTILNSDSTVSFINDTFSVHKDVSDGMATISLLRQGSTNGTCSVDFYTSTNGSALPVTDYTPTNGTVLFSPGQTNASFAVPIINNGLAEGDTTVGLVLTNAVNTLLQAPTNATLTIFDSTSSSSIGQIFFAMTNYVVNEGDGSVGLTVLRTNGAAPSGTVYWTTVPNTALPTINYTAASGQFSMDVDQTTYSISVKLKDNSQIQGTVNFSVLLYGCTNLVAPTNATVTILDNDTGVAFLNATNYVSETNSVGAVYVQRLGLTNTTVTADYYSINGTGTNAAMAGTNFTAITDGHLIFVPGETLKVISLPLLRDPRVTGDLVFGLVLTNVSGGLPAYPSNAVVVIQDGDAGLSFTNATLNVAKNSGSATIMVVCSNTNVEPVSVDYSTADGSAQANIHYVPVSGTLTFSNGVATNMFVVPIINNGIIDSNRSFTVNLSNPTVPGQVVSPGTLTVTITEDNNGFSFSSPAYTVLRSGVAQVITVVRTGNTDTVASVYFSATNGTAIAGYDYQATNGIFVFTNGVTSQTFSVPLIANTAVQADKTVLLQLFNPSNSILSAPSAATLTIHDTSGSLVVPAGSALISENLVANGIIDPGEKVTLLFAFRAAGGNDIPSVYATLLPTNGITSPSPSGSQLLGSLTVGGASKSKAFSFTASGTNSQQIAATFQINNGLTNIGTAVFTYSLGTWTNLYTNSALITINDNAAASPYPSSIIVSNLGGTLIKATVTFTNLTHKSPGDIDALLVSPSQLTTMLMAHAGAQNAVKHVTLTFDDASTNTLPQNGQIISGTNKPADYASPLIQFP
jgi:uncharacterized delta-60 repeat protein